MTSGFGNLLPRWHAFAVRRRALVLALAGLLWAGLALLVGRLAVSGSSIDFYPDSNGLRTLARGMDLAPFSRFVLVDVSAGEGVQTNRDEVAEVALNFADQIPQRLASLVENNAPDPAVLATLLPSLFDAQAEAVILDRIAPNVVRSRMAETYAMLASFATGPATGWLRQDPLGWRDLLTPHSPSLNLALGKDDCGVSLSSDGRRALIMLRPVGSMHDTNFAVAFMSSLEKAKAHLPKDFSATIAGGVRHTAANAETIASDIKHILLLSLAGLALVYAIFVRSWGAVWIFLTPCFAVTVAMGMVGLFFATLSGLALGFGCAVLGIAEDYAVHMHFALRACPDKPRVFGELAVPLLQGLALNACGFALLLFSSMPAVRQLSAFALCALLAGFGLAVFLLPICPWFDSPSLLMPKVTKTEAREPILWKTVICAGAMATGATFLFADMPVDVSPRSLGAGMQAIQKDALTVQRHWEPSQAVIFLAEDTDMAGASAKANRLEEELKTLNPGIETFSIADLVPVRDQLEANLVRWSAFQATHGPTLTATVKDEAKRLGIEDEFFRPFYQMLEERPSPVSADLLRHLGLGDAIDGLAREFPGDGVAQALVVAKPPANASTREITIPAFAEGVVPFAPAELESALKTVFASETKFLPATFALCVVLLFCCFGNVAKTMLAAVPPVCSVLCVLACLKLAGKPLTLASLAAFPCVIGLAIDHGIMVVHELSSGKKLGIDRAMVVSSLTACSGMGLLAFAEHPALRAMGEVVFLGLAMEVPASLWLLPHFCRKRRVNP